MSDTLGDITSLPSHYHLSVEHFYRLKDHLLVEDGILFINKKKIVVSASLWFDMLIKVGIVIVCSYYSKNC